MPLAPSGQYDKAFQQDMLAHTLRTSKLLNLLVTDKISALDFDLPIHRAIITAAKEVAGKVGVENIGDHIVMADLLVPLRLMIKAKIVLPDEVPGLKECLKAIYSRELSVHYFESVLKAFLREQRTLRAYRKGDIMDLEGLKSDLNDVDLSVSFDGKASHKPLLNVNLAEAEIQVPCGLASIDQRMRGGLGLKRSMLICAFTGMGKTALAVNMSLGSALMGFPAGLVQTEIPQDEMDFRLYACAARYSYDLVQFGSNGDDLDIDEDLKMEGGLSRDEIQNHIRHRLGQYPPHLMGNYNLFDYSDRVCTIQSIRDDLHRHQDENPENPIKVLDVDWLECIDLPPTSNRNKQIQEIKISELRHKLEATSQLFTQLCVSENIAGRMYTQSDFSAEDKAVVKMSNKSEGKGSSRRYSWFLGMGATREDLEKNVVTVTAGKARNGRLFSCKMRRALHEQRFEDLQEQDERAEIDAALQLISDQQFMQYAQ